MDERLSASQSHNRRSTALGAICSGPAAAAHKLAGDVAPGHALRTDRAALQGGLHVGSQHVDADVAAPGLLIQRLEPDVFEVEMKFFAGW